MSDTAIILIALAALFGVLTLVFVTALCRVCVKQTCRRIADGAEDGRLMLPRKRRSRAFIAVKKSLFIILAAAALFFAVNAVVFRLSGGRKYLGFAALAVASGSMSYVSQTNDLPSDALSGFDALDLIFIVSADESQLALYDIVAYRSAEGAIIIHRIVDITQLGGRTYYVMRGDANTAADGTAISYEAVIGKYCGAKIPGLGAAILFLQSWYGIVTVVVLVYIVCVYDSSVKKIKSAEKSRRAVIEN